MLESEAFTSVELSKSVSSGHEKVSLATLISLHIYAVADNLSKEHLDQTTITAEKD